MNTSRPSNPARRIAKNMSQAAKELLEKPGYTFRLKSGRMIENPGEAILTTCAEMALAGNLQAMKLLYKIAYDEKIAKSSPQPLKYAQVMDLRPPHQSAKDH